MKQLKAILKFLFATSKYQDFDFERFEQLESRKTITKVGPR